MLEGDYYILRLVNAVKQVGNKGKQIGIKSDQSNIYSLPVEDSCAGDGEGHHHDQVGQEGKGAEHQVSARPEPCLDHLQQFLENKKRLWL